MSSDPPVGDDLPVQTVRVKDILVKTFSDHLMERAASFVRQRGSATMTDADLQDAYRHLTRPTQTSKSARCIGDGALAFGGFLIGLYAIHWLLILAGIALCAAGLYIREWVA